MISGRLTNETEPIPNRRRPSTRTGNRRSEHRLLPHSVSTALGADLLKSYTAEVVPPCPNAFPLSHLEEEEKDPIPRLRKRLHSLYRKWKTTILPADRHRPDLRQALTLRLRQGEVYAPETAHVTRSRLNQKQQRSVSVMNQPPERRMRRVKLCFFF